ncbi:unnamed protein product [Aureobasidium mustum]|uniref:NAD(P)-binding protein n=1 Tax=Aureobasidium mustum TaxID=2773714 RepID=A0A9N8JT49_9PEZI|nr:unnamed protein product [Aureobasidium mustum]
MSNIVLVSGANQGIGYEIAKQLSQMSDYHVFLGSRDLDKGKTAATQIQEIGGSVEAIQLDVTDRKSLSAVRQYIETKFERLDVLVSNAAILLDPKVSPEYSLGQATQDTFATNTSGAADLAGEFVPLLKRSRLPRMVFVSSGYASLHFFANFTPSYTTAKFFTPAYACSKAALNMLMLHYNVQYGNKGWKINACCPGFTKTNFSNHDEQAGPAQESAQIAVKLATLNEDGETGTFVNTKGQIAW